MLVIGQQVAIEQECDNVDTKLEHVKPYCTYQGCCYWIRLIGSYEPYILIAS